MRDKNSTDSINEVFVEETTCSFIDPKDYQYLLELQNDENYCDFIPVSLVSPAFTRENTNLNLNSGPQKLQFPQNFKVPPPNMNDTVYEAYIALENKSRQDLSYLNAKIEAIDRIHSKNYQALAIRILKLIDTQKVQEKEMRSLKQSIPQRGVREIILKPNLLPLLPEELIKASIVFDNEDKFHPHRFVEIFENYVASANMTDFHKCITFRQIIIIDGAEDWKDFTGFDLNFAELKQSFLEYFWSYVIQREAMEAFESQLITFESTASLIFELKRWISTLKNVRRPYIEDILHTAFLKLPDYLSCRVTDEERTNEELFLARISTFKD